MKEKENMGEKGLIYAVGIGPGNFKNMTAEALSAMESSDVICGYGVYLELVKPLFEAGGPLCGGAPKEFFSSAMRQETERCMKAVEFAEAGKTVAMVCSGDSGVYGMAGLLMELSEGRDIEIVNVPGITAAIAGAALLGAPIGHDFSVISLSNLLTEQALIDKRLVCAAESDMIICLYNPKSHRRRDTLANACEILLKTKSPDTACGWVKNIGREGEEAAVCRLSELSEQPVDMFTTVFVGSSSTRIIGNKLLTPRGYGKK